MTVYQSDIRLSVALVTRNRPESLERTLKSLRRQSVQPWEIVISDDSDLEAFTAKGQQLAAEYECRYTPGPQGGLYANRNHAALQCQGSHIRTMDDDHEFPSDHLALCMEALHSDSTSVWIIGEFLPGEDTTINMPVCPGQLFARGFSVAPKDAQRCWAISDGASIYPRFIFDHGFRYADYYKFGAAYLEFGSLLYWKGLRIRHLEKTYVIHHYDPSTRSFLNAEVDLSSRFFAMFCHSYIYQATPKNKILCGIELLKQIIFHPISAYRAIPNGILGYRKRRHMYQFDESFENV